MPKLPHQSAVTPVDNADVATKSYADSGGLGVTSEKLTVAITTYNRAALLRKSIVGHARAGAEVRVYDASEAAGSNENKAMIRSVERELRIKVRYNSIRDTKLFVRMLAKQGIDPALAECALLGSVGAVRNCALLDTAGDKVVLCEDDVIAPPKVWGSYKIASFRNRREGLKTDPSGFFNYKSEEEALSAVSTHPEGSISGILDLVGERVEKLRSCYKAEGRMVLGARSEGRIIAAQTGWAGRQPGTDWAQTSMARGRLYHRQLAEGEAWVWGVPNLVFQPTQFLRAFYVALDNRLALPPFFSGEDAGLMGGSLYGAILARAFSRSQTAFVPEVVTHTSGQPKARTKDLVLSGTILVEEAARQAESMEHLSETLIAPNYEALLTAAEDRIKAVVHDRALETEVKIKPLNTEQKQNISSFGSLIKGWPGMVRAAKIVRENGVSPTVLL